MLPSRAWEILIGSLLGYLYYKKKFEFNINYSVYYFLYISCLIIIILSFFFIDIHRFSHPSFITLIPLIATSIIIFIESSKKKGCLKILNNKYLVFVGKISYSLYLWHFLFFAIYRNSYLEENLTIKILIIFLSFLFSTLTYKYIENVFRDKKITSKKKLTYYVIFSLSIIFLINLNYLYNKKIISKYEIDNIYLTEWKDTKQILTYVKKNNLKEFPINNKINVLIVGTCHADDTFVALKLNQNNFKNFNFILFPRTDVGNFISHTNSKLYKNADIIIFSTKWNAAIDDLSSLPDLIKKIKQDKKKVVLFSGFPEFSPLHEKVYGWTKIQLTEYKKIIFDKKTTKLSDIELTNLRKKYYLKLNTQKELIDTNNRLKEISKQNNIKYINAELFFCNHEKKECLVRLDDFNEIYRDYGRHSMPGLKLMGSMISKDFF